MPQARPAPRISYGAPLRSLLDSARRVPALDLAQRYGPPPSGRRAHRRDAGYGGVPAIFGEARAAAPPAPLAPLTPGYPGA